MTNKEVLTNYVITITEALKNAGAHHVVISPGSRSTPLAYAFASDEQFSISMQVDERSAAFYALGLAKASLKPVILLCTSGTAASNYYPAITEAHYARLPLIVLTADRPHELREVGAPQAINQIELYGKHVKWSIDLPLAEHSSDVLRFVERHIQRGTSHARTHPMGPVHFNVPFREPLLIDTKREHPIKTYAKRIDVKEHFDSTALAEVNALLENAPSGIIVAGELPITFDRFAFWQFAKSLQWPVLCDPLSNLRAEVPIDCKELCIDQYDAMLKNEVVRQELVPHTVLRIGAQPVSKPLSQFMKSSCPTHVIVIDEVPHYRDFLHIATHHIQASPNVLCQLDITRKLTQIGDKWIRLNELFSRVLHENIVEGSDEGAYAYTLFKHLQDGVDLISSSSMPIRDVDTFFTATQKDIKIFANRGANGIDGVVSTALGIQKERGRQAFLLIGDLAFLHDVNGLIATRFTSTDLTIVIMNNDGGGIFSYLPQASESTYFEQLFGTPTGLTFESIAHMYDAQYEPIHQLKDFISALQKEKTKPIRIIEVFTDRESNVQAHRALWETMNQQLEHFTWDN